MPQTTKSTDTAQSLPQMVKETHFPVTNDGAPFDMKYLTSSEEKALNEVTKAWFDKQPITGVGGARRFQYPAIRYANFTRLCSSIVEDGWTVSQSVHRPTLFPSTFEEKAVLVGTLKEDTNDFPEKGIHLKRGANVWALPKVNDRRDDISMIFKTDQGFAVPNSMVNLMPQYVQRARLWDCVVFHHDERQNHRITEYNLKLAVAIFRERLKESAKENRELSDIELCHKVPATGFEAANFATPVFDARVLRNTLRRRGHLTLEAEIAALFQYNSSSQGNHNGAGQS